MGAVADDGPCTAADEEFEELCFEYGIELDDVVGDRRPAPLAAAAPAQRVLVALLTLLAP